MYTCLFCGEPERSPEVKFCKYCGSNWMPFEPGMNDAAAIKRYKNQIQELLFEDPEADHKENFDNLRKRLKIDFAVHQELYESIRSQLAMAEHLKAFRIDFDENIQDSYAGHDTRLSFRFTNLSTTERFSVVSLYWDDKETTDDMDFRAENDATVKPRETVFMGSTHVFMRPGTKEIKGLEITIENVVGDTAKFRAETFHIKVGNPDQRVYNNVTTNTTITGKVVDATGVAANTGVAEVTGDKGEVWRKLSFVYLPAEEDDSQEMEKVRKLAASSVQKAPTEPATVQPEVEEKPETVAAPELVSPVMSPAPAHPATEGMTLRDAVEKTLENLLKFSSLSSSAASKGVFSAVDFSLNLLEIIHGETPDSEMDSIVGLVFETPAGVVTDNEQFIINFADNASVVTLSGITIIGKDGNTVVGHANYDWGQMAANGWGFFRQRFGPGSYVISFGDQSANQNFSGLRFDLRRYKGPESVDQIYAESEALLQRIFELAPAFEAYDETEQDEEFADSSQEAVAQAVAEEDADALADAYEEEDEAYEEESEDDEEEEEEDPAVAAAAAAAAQRFLAREKCLGKFLKQYAFAMQQCVETAPRSIFPATTMTPELFNAIHTDNGMLAVGLDPAQAQFSADGKLAGWTGAASALSGHGIYHMVSAGGGTYAMDGSNCFLSWEKFFFEIKADLVTRDAGPDLWLGTADKFLVRGSYCDYSGNIPQWDYFEDFAKQGLLEAFASFKQSI